MEEAVRVPGAQESPRMGDDNIIRWYYGDTFEIHWYLTLRQGETPIIYDPEDQIIFSFYIAGTNKLIHRFVCKNIDPETNMAILIMDKSTSLKFKPGRYSFGMKFVNYSQEDDGDGNMVMQKHSQDITTVGAKYLVEVERCQ